MLDDFDVIPDEKKPLDKSTDDVDWNEDDEDDTDEYPMYA